MRNVLCLVGVLLLIPSGLFAAPAEPARGSAPTKAADLYQTDKVWTVHFTFTPEQWEAMEPKGGGFGRFGGGPGRGGPGGPGGGGPGGPGGPGGFGPGNFLAPVFLKPGDLDHDGKLSASEFHNLGATWFAQWDKQKTGKLTVDELGAGLGSVIGFGGPGGRGGGMRLQGAEGKRNGLASAAGIEFKYVHADIDFDGQALKNVAVRYKGNGTWMQSQGQLKRSLKVDTNEFVKGQKLAGITKLNFHSNVTDASWMNEVLSHKLYRDAGVPAPRTTYARVYLTVPGKYDNQYVGLYSMVEDPDRHFARERFGEKHGAIFKPVTPAPFEDLGDDWAQYQQTYDPKTELKPEQGKRLIEFAKLVSHADDAEFAAKLPDYLDLDETARYMAVTVWLCTLDSILGVGQNYYVYLDPRTNQFQFMPWDLDHSFGQFGMQGSQEQREQLSINHPWRGDIRFLDRLFKVEAFKKLYLAKLEEFGKTIFVPKRFHEQVDHLAAALRPAVADESKDMLERFDTVVSGKPAEPMTRIDRPGGPREARDGAARGDDRPRMMMRGGFGGGAKPIKGFVDARARSVNEQLAGQSQGLQMDGGFGGRRGGPDRGPGAFLGTAFMNVLDADKDSRLTADEMARGFDKWFADWNGDKSGQLSEEQLRDGINQVLMGGGRGPRQGGFGGGARRFDAPPGDR
jgi:hypothetical protein